MKYSKKDLRSVDTFALFFILSGGLITVSGILSAISKVHPHGVGLIGLGVSFLCLGTALNLGVRQVVANKGEDISDPIDEIGNE